MEFALNYSAVAVDLLRRQVIEVDLFKCPAWPEQIKAAQALKPAYVHFPLRVGPPTGVVLNAETESVPDWTWIEALLADTSTPWVNIHLGAQPKDYPDIPVHSTRPEDLRHVTEILVRSVASIVDRFGADHVVAENIFGAQDMHLRASTRPEVMRDVVEATGCGLLLDLSHARLAAEELRCDPQAYIADLPVDKIREIHVTGIQYFGPQWVAHARAKGMDDEDLCGLSDRRLDHLPMTLADWDFLAWALEQIDHGVWRPPELVAFEYGGLGGFFKPTTIEEALVTQVPRMLRMVRYGANGHDPHADQDNVFWR